LLLLLLLLLLLPLPLLLLLQGCGGRRLQRGCALHSCCSLLTAQGPGF
jgi:hypothetical protein